MAIHRVNVFGHAVDPPMLLLIKHNTEKKLFPAFAAKCLPNTVDQCWQSVTECINCIILKVGKKTRYIYLHELHLNLVLYLSFVALCAKLAGVYSVLWQCWNSSLRAHQHLRFGRKQLIVNSR